MRTAPTREQAAADQALRAPMRHRSQQGAVKTGLHRGRVVRRKRGCAVVASEVRTLSAAAQSLSGQRQEVTSSMRRFRLRAGEHRVSELDTGALESEAAQETA